MAPIRVVSSVVSPRALAEVLSRTWGFDVQRCQVLNHGINDHYVVEHAAGRHVFRLYAAGRDDKSISFELELTRHVAQAGVHVSAPIAAANGDWYVGLDAPEGPRVGVLWTEAKGRLCSSADATAYGRELARLHTAADSFRCEAPRSFDLNFMVRSRVEAVRQLLSRTPGATDWFDDEVTHIVAAFEQSSRTAVDVGACHGDAHTGNGHVEDRRVTLFDMEFCGYGPRVYDLATYRYGIALYGLDDPSHWPDFLDGYSSVRAILPPDLALVDLYVAAHNVWVMGHWAGADTLYPHSHERPASWIERALKIGRDFPADRSLND